MGCDPIVFHLFQRLFFTFLRNVVRRSKKRVEKSEPSLARRRLRKLKDKLIGKRIKNKIQVRVLSVGLELDSKRP